MGFRTILLKVPFEGLNVGIDYFARDVLMNCFIHILILACLCFLAEPEITEFDVSISANENVIRFNIAMNIVLLMNAFDRQYLNERLFTIYAA